MKLTHKQKKALSRALTCGLSRDYAHPRTISSLLRKNLVKPCRKAGWYMITDLGRQYLSPNPPKSLPRLDVSKYSDRIIKKALSMLWTAGAIRTFGRLIEMFRNELDKQGVRPQFTNDVILGPICYQRYNASPIDPKRLPYNSSFEKNDQQLKQLLDQLS